MIFCRKNMWSSDHKKITFGWGGGQKSSPKAPLAKCKILQYLEVAINADFGLWLEVNEVNPIRKTTYKPGRSNLIVTNIMPRGQSYDTSEIPSAKRPHNFWQLKIDLMRKQIRRLVIHEVVIVSNSYYVFTWTDFVSNIILFSCKKYDFLVKKCLRARWSLFLVQFPNDDVVFFLSEQFCMGFEIIKKKIYWLVCSLVPEWQYIDRSS